MKRYLTFLGLAGGGIGVSVFFLYFLEGKFTRSYLEEFNKRQLILAENATREMEEYLNNLFTHLKLLSQRKEVRLSSPGDKKIFERTYKVLKDRIFDVGRLDKKGRMIYTFPESEVIGKDLSWREHFKIPKEKGAPYLSPVFPVVREGGWRAFVLSYPLSDEKGSFKGTVRFLVKMDEFIRLFILPLYRENKTYPWLIDPQGKILYHPRAEYIDKNFREVIPSEHQKLREVIIPEMLKGKQGRGYYRWREKGEKKPLKRWVAYAPLKSPFFFGGLAVSAREKDILTPLISVRRVFYGAGGALILFITLIFLFTIKSEVKRSREATHRLRFISALQEIDRTTLSSMELKDALRVSARLITQVMEASSSVLMLLEEGVLKVKSFFGIPPEEEETMEKHEVGPGECICGWAMVHQKPVFVLDLDKDPRCNHHRPLLKRMGIRSVFSTPMKVKGKVRGCLCTYFKEPKTFKKEEEENLVGFANQVAISIHNAELLEEIRNLSMDTVATLAQAIDARDPYTSEHSQRVTKYAMEIGKNLNLSESDLRVLNYAALIHDIGKIGVRGEVLRKPGKLNPEERSHIEKHPLIGAQILKKIRLFKPLLPVVYHHHERWDGKGYPDGIGGEKIPLRARILALADAFEAMTSDRPYRKAFPREKAREEIKKCSGTQFDPHLVQIFLSLFSSGSLGF